MHISQKMLSVKQWDSTLNCVTLLLQLHQFWFFESINCNRPLGDYQRAEATAPSPLYQLCLCSRDINLNLTLVPNGWAYYKIDRAIAKAGILSVNPHPTRTHANQDSWVLVERVFIGKTPWSDLQLFDVRPMLWVACVQKKASHKLMKDKRGVAWLWCVVWRMHYKKQ